MKYIMFLMIGFLTAGCGIVPTESMKMNAASLSDGTDILIKEGCAPNNPMVIQLHRNALTTEEILGSPKARINPRDLVALEENRQKAASDNQKGGFWFIFGSTALAGLSLLLSGLGLNGLATWIKGRSDELIKWKDTAQTASQDAQKYASFFELLVKSIKNYMETADAGQTSALKTAIRTKTTEAGIKLDFDKEVKKVL